MSQSTATKREMAADKRETVVGKRMSSPNKRKSASKNARQRRKKSKRRRTATPEETAEKRLLFELFGWDSDTELMPQENETLCLICEHTFSNPSSRHRHERAVHGGLKNFTCDVCSKAFGYKGHLNQHIRAVHKRAKPFECKTCQKSFSRKGSLKTHTRDVHEKRKDFDCPHCDYSAARNHSLQSHIDMVHLKLKPHSCKLCSMKFTTKSDLTVHIRTHSGSQPYKCAECDQRFSCSSNRNAHQLGHEKAGKVTCPHADGCIVEHSSNGIPCGMFFKDEKDLARHVKMAHTAAGLANKTHSTEQLMADFFDKNGIDYTRDQANTISLRACAEMKLEGHRVRPDFFLGALSSQVGYHVLIGNDEAAHRRYPCDFKRIIEMNTALCQGSVGPTGKIVYIRVNPSPYKVDGVLHTPSLEQVHAKLLTLLKALPSMELLSSLNLIYLDYDQTSQIHLRPWQRLSCFSVVKEINQQNAEMLREWVFLVL
jgi:uncharacterized C2H2 Zn-finger protein